VADLLVIKSSAVVISTWSSFRLLATHTTGAAYCEDDGPQFNLKEKNKGAVGMMVSTQYKKK
jgi:hypothetical protein